jgi:putative ABC transport system ATP-binding protein
MIELHDIKKSFKLGKSYLPILKGVDLKINSGEYVTLMGPSGSGKSTLLGILSGIESPSSGSVIIDGENISELPESKLASFRNQHIGIVFQSFNLIPSLTALENVMAPIFVAKNKKDIKERSIETLKKVGLGDRVNHKPSELSGGQQQRVAIARALVTSPSILVADEPTGNLDSKTGKQILELFNELQDDLNVTLIIATHDEGIAEQSDRVIKIKDGVII